MDLTALQQALLQDYPNNAGRPIFTPQPTSSSAQSRFGGICTRTFNPRRYKRYGGRKTIMTQLVKYSPKWGYARIFNFPFIGSHWRPRMNTIVIQVHGTAIPNSTTDPIGRAGAGISFGGDTSPHNAYFAVLPYMPQTANRATLEAVKTVLGRLITLRETASTLDPRWKEVFIMTNNEYVKNSLSKFIWQWERNGWKHTTGGGGTIENLDGMQEIENLLIYIESSCNMAVRFWKVNREDLAGADDLSHLALREV